MKIPGNMAIGQKYNQLTVIRFVGVNKQRGKNQVYPKTDSLRKRLIMDKKQITIFVAGGHNSAKTTTIAIIEKALRDAGLSPKLLSVAASEAENFVGEKHLAEITEEIKDKVEISIEELTLAAPLLEGNIVPKGYVAIRHAGGMKIIPRGTGPAE